MKDKMLPCMKKPKTEQEKLEAEAMKDAEWENSLEYHLLTRGRNYG